MKETPAAQGTVADALLKHFGDSNRTTLTAREAGRQAANVARQVLAAAPSPEALPASGVEVRQQALFEEALVGHFGTSNTTAYTAREAGRQAAIVVRDLFAALTSAPAPEDR